MDKYCDRIGNSQVVGVTCGKHITYKYFIFYMLLYQLLKLNGIEKQIFLFLVNLQVSQIVRYKKQRKEIELREIRCRTSNIYCENV
uniref:Uncharacterized protein n=1 Tax=Onchocerca volvulus TaxID=6282 RepID=A0A8R1XT54_ONCVO